MKKLMIMLAIAVGFTALASQNDPLIPVTVEKDATYDVLCKGEKQFSFTSNKTGSATVQGIASKSTNAADYQVRLMSTAPEQTANDGETSGSGEELPIASIANVVCSYADSTVVLPGERLIVVQCDKGHEFKGVNYNGLMNDGIYNAPLKSFLASNGGKFAIDDLPGLKPELYDYYPIVLDTRLPNGVLSADLEGTPTLVRAWGEFVGNGETSVLWHEIELGGNAFAQGFDFDPTSMLADGYAAIYGMYGEGDTKWYVFPTPCAYVSNVTSKVELDATKNYWAINPQPVEIGNKFTLEAAYSFCAFKDAEEQDLVLAVIGDMRAVDIKKLNPADVYTDEPAKQAKFYEWFVRVVPFFDWNADFEVSFDGEIAKDSVILAGSYGYHEAWGSLMPAESEGMSWAGSSVPFTMAPGKKFRLLTDNGKYDVKVTYAEICTKVREFMCGVYNHAAENYGKTITVRLNLYQTKRDASGYLKETGRKYTVGTYRYTFCGPLSITYVKNTAGDAPTGNWEVPPATNLFTDGKSLVRLGVPTYDKDGNKDIAFVGWTNGVDEALYTLVPSNTWGAITLGSVWKKAQTVQVTPKEGQQKAAEIKVTEEWAKEKLGLDDATVKNPELLSNALDETAQNGKPVWQNYLLGLDPLDPNAKLKVASTEGAQEDKAIVVSTVEVAPPDTGFRVEYSLDKLKDDVTQDKDKEVDRKDTKDLAIELEPSSGDTPTGYYKMNVIVTPEKSDGEPDVANQVTIPADNTIGVIRVESEEKIVPVAVPWLSLEKGEEVLPNEIVDPRTLSEDDKLHVYNDKVGGQSDIYSTWIVKGGVWKPVDTVKVDNALQSTMLTKAAAREGSVQCGKGAWLERHDTTRPFYLIGQYDKEAEVSVQIKPPAEPGKAEYNLIAPTSIAETDLNAIPSLTSESVNSKDQLMVMHRGVPTFLRPHEVSGGKKEWGYYKSVVDLSRGYPVVRQVWSTEAANVDAGLGLWYISSGGKPTIVWKEGEKQDAE